MQEQNVQNRNGHRDVDDDKEVKEDEQNYFLNLRPFKLCLIHHSVKNYCVLLNVQPITPHCAVDDTQYTIHTRFSYFI